MSWLLAFSATVEAWNSSSD